VNKLLIVSTFGLTLFAASAFADEWTGYISDAKCGAKGNSEAHAQCADKCVKGGSAAVFVADGKVYKIADQSKVQEHVGHKVTLTGKLEGDTITIDSVRM
jgi:hypothetical protein